MVVLNQLSDFLSLTFLAPHDIDVKIPKMISEMDKN